MAHLLHIDSSAVRHGSVSREIAAAFRQAFSSEHPTGTVTGRDLGTDPVPHLLEPGVTAQYVPAAARSEAQAAAAEVRERLVAELLAADVLLLSTPMYNWSIPAQLKAWFDQVLVNGVVLPPAGQAGPLAGRPAVAVVATGGGYGPGTPREGWDHVEAYLRTVLRDALGMDLTVITAPLTLAARVPAMSHLTGAAEAARTAAVATAAGLGRELGAARNPYVHR